ncbi:MAG: VanZ family protein [Flavisolibacter sp.]
MVYFKKLLVVLPVLVLGTIYLYVHRADYRHTAGPRLLFLAFNLFLLYGWIFLETWKRKQKNLVQVTLQSSFYVYFFMVLSLTGYFILFREVSAHGWWHRMIERVEHRERVNLELFKMFKIYKLSSRQIVGNFIMLLPLGLYLPLLYRRARSFFAVAFIAFTVSFLIELLQLVTSFRSADVDDILLNTTGACFGFVIYAGMRELILSLWSPSPMSPTA